MKASEFMKEIEDIVDDFTAPSGNMNPQFFGEELKKQIRVAFLDYLNSPSQQASVDRRDVVHNKETSDAGENPVSDTKEEQIKNEGGKHG